MYLFTLYKYTPLRHDILLIPYIATVIETEHLYSATRSFSGAPDLSQCCH